MVGYMVALLEIGRTFVSSPSCSRVQCWFATGPLRQCPISTGDAHETSSWLEYRDQLSTSHVSRSVWKDAPSSLRDEVVWIARCSPSRLVSRTFASLSLRNVPFG